MKEITQVWKVICDTCGRNLGYEEVFGTAVVKLTAHQRQNCEERKAA